MHQNVNTCIIIHSRIKLSYCTCDGYVNISVRNGVFVFVSVMLRGSTDSSSYLEKLGKVRGI